MSDGRLEHLVTFYSILAELEAALGGARTLRRLSGFVSRARMLLSLGRRVHRTFGFQARCDVLSFRYSLLSDSHERQLAQGFCVAVPHWRRGRIGFERFT